MSSFLGWLWSGVRSVLETFKLANKQGKLVFIGVDNAGKTSLLYALKENAKMSAFMPTWQPTNEELTLGGIDFVAWDLGGHFQARRLWAHYMPAVDGIVFLVDAADTERLDEVRQALNSVLSDDGIADVPVLVLGNKIDKRGALSYEQLTAGLKLQGQYTGKGTVPRTQLNGTRPLELFMCTIKGKSGYGDGIRWLAQYI